MIIYYTDKYTGGREESHRLLGEAITAHTGDAELAERLTGSMKKGEHGKPYIEGFSCFSISHTGSIWAVLFADCECGLDIQLAKDCNVRSISCRWFAAEDARALEGLSGDDAEREFFRMWARREALVKALGRSVYETGLPTVMSEEAEIDGKHYCIGDVEFPSDRTAGTESIYAAVCTEGRSACGNIRFSSIWGYPEK